MRGNQIDFSTLQVLKKLAPLPENGFTAIRLFGET
jgi:hypothetical protein